ncbi:MULTISPECIES: MotA/TolQ/ExbB proton channel family protein [Edaphocola]|jgi:biopolymer transport protein ExbB|uniref:MotA/TolQ/ExbB proton channel family protein n=1 Tax=Edaphocola TaxID=2601681 RepID=UPI000FAFD8C1|nr:MULTISPECIES: MotA/TolQ/ExbB proton channel family protein [Edaphocola]
MAEVRNAPKAAAPTKSNKSNNSNGFWVNLAIVALCIVVGQLIYHMVLGDPSHFMDAEKHKPKPGDFMGNMYLGGFIVPLLMATFLVMLAFVIERAVTIMKAKGKTNGGEFVRKVQYHLANKNIDAAIAECDKQSGSVGNVMRAGLLKYKEMTVNTELTHDEKLLSIQKEVEEATALEVPMLEKNLVFLSTIASAATLLGLIGTVIGMIKSFSAMANAGAPDATALAAGISEALYNTALGISTSFFAIIFYNFYTTLIDGVNYNIDESGFTLTQSFAVNYK